MFPTLIAMLGYLDQRELSTQAQDTIKYMESWDEAFFDSCPLCGTQ